MSVIISGTDGVSDVDGSAGTPAIRGTDTNTGIFFGSDIIGFSEGGTECARFNADAQFVAAAGTASLPVLTTTGDLNTGIFFPAADTIAFAEGGTEAMRIDSSGNVGIGTSSVSTDYFSDRILQLTGPNSAAIKFERTSATVRKWEVGLTTGGNFDFVDTVGDATTPRARITSGGDFLVGRTTPGGAERLSVEKNASGQEVCRMFNTASSTAFGMVIFYTNANPNNTTDAFYAAYSQGATLRFQVRSNGGIANYSANNANLSDRREKTNFAPAKNYLDTICAIPVQTFNYIDQNNEDDPGLTLGVVAQDVQEVAPELVMESNWAGRDQEPKMRLSIYQTDLQYALMKSIQELKAINDAQASRIETLEAKVAALEANDV